MSHFISQKDDFLITTDPALLNLVYIHNYLSTQSYWAKNIPYEIVKRSIANSYCFGLYCKGEQIGFARVITDFATFGYLCDVFIDANYRGRGLAIWLMDVIHAHPALQGFRNWLLGTKDAHNLYKRFGYGVHPEPNRIMRKHDPNVYDPLI